MIVIRLRGGLGNQLFQYAAGRRLAWRHGTELKLDVEPLERSGERHFALDHFEIAAEPATAAELRRCCSPIRTARLARWLLGKPAGPVRGPDSGFVPAVLDLPDDVCLDGYWQSERYFADAAGVLRRELRFREGPTGRNRELSEEISSCESVCIHVRRGDYVTNPVANQILGPCDLDYYHRAVEHLDGTVQPRCYYLFSDDPEWVRLNLLLDSPIVIVDHNSPDRPHEDLRLMSLCHHHVIANSSFSWWGAWLAESDGRRAGAQRIVIAPRRWYRSEEYRADDLIPGRWLRL